ncbi:MAG: hypothetical protein WC979_02660 [Candidatus Pacearchaeota archaeon]|jgi:hypothetical protein|nr:hypothetical protein [Clostridia bacterium]
MENYTDTKLSEIVVNPTNEKAEAIKGFVIILGFFGLFFVSMWIFA